MPLILNACHIEKRFSVDRPLLKQVASCFARKPMICALQGVSLSAEAGEIVGIVGPNGAGKTTLLRILADVLEADAGFVEICGRRTTRAGGRVRRDIGYVSSDERSFFWRLTGRQNLAFFAALYGVRRAEADKRIAAILDDFNLTDKAEQLFRDYSSGTRKKFALARALIHRPPVMLLDEITNSLDPPSSQRVKAMLREYISKEESRVALWSTHRLEEIGEICDRVISLEHGTVSFSGSAWDFTAAKSVPAEPARGDENLRHDRTFFDCLSGVPACRERLYGC